MILIYDVFSGLALLIWFFDFSLFWSFDFTDVLFALIAATCSFIAFILLFLSESFILWVLSDVILVELWVNEVLFIFSSQLFLLINLCIILSFDFNSTLFKSPIVVRSLFITWSFDFSSYCSWSNISIMFSGRFYKMLSLKLWRSGDANPIVKSGKGLIDIKIIIQK